MMDLMMLPVILLFIADGESLRFLTQLFEEHARVMQATAYHILGSHPVIGRVRPSSFCRLFSMVIETFLTVLTR